LAPLANTVKIGALLPSPGGFSMRPQLCPGLVLALLAAGPPAFPRGLASTDVLRMQSAGDVAVASDGARLAYTVERSDRSGRPEKQLFVLTVAEGKSVRVGGENDTGGGAWFSPDGRWLAFKGKIDGKGGLHVARADGGGPRFLAEVQGTNSPLTHEGESVAWSPDSKRIAYVSAVPGPETAAMTGDPIVITRYIYKPDFAEGTTRFHDARRRHIFIVDADGGAPHALTAGDYEEHSIDWSPDGAEIVCISNREPDPDLFYNPDVFAVRVADGRLRRITATESAEYRPRFSPDGRTILFLGTRRGLTDLETTMEDTHVWTMAADGSARRELGAAVDNRQYDAVFSPDGSSVYFTVQERGLVKLFRIPTAGGAAEAVVSERGRVTSFALGPRGALAYTFTSDRDLAQLYVRDANAPARRLTELNADLLAGVEIAPVESFTFVSADFKWDVEAFLTKPLDLLPDGKHPLVVMIHGGPHGAQGPAFSFKSQFYAGRGYATLQVNFRGSTSYGQKFADAVFGDQNGQEAMDVLYGVSAALRRNPWIDRDRMGVEGGSYGGQLSCWLVTQTPIFKAAIPLAPIVNNLSYNYMTYYNQYEEMEWGACPHQGNLMDVLWERSALKHVAAVKTPTMLIHGENDNDVPIAESEQFYVALRDVGVEAVLVRYPREGHGLREGKHLVDLMDRSVAWYEKHFAAGPSRFAPR
jgi:dipeptidyl aminopeptidase/acylaminoacyl peptidase